MIEYSVGVASACIAAGIAILQFILPNTLALLLSGSLSDSHSAITWSVVSRFLLSTDWPLALRSDAAASDTVPRRIAFLTYLKPFTLMLLAIAAVMTPLGRPWVCRDRDMSLTIIAGRVDRWHPSDRNRDRLLCILEGRGCAWHWNIRTKRPRILSRLRHEHPLPLRGRRWQCHLTVAQFSSNEVTYLDWIIRTPKLLPQVVDMFQSGLTERMSTICGFFDIEFC